MGSLKRLTVIVALLVLSAAGALIAYDLFIQSSINFPDFADNLVRISLIIGFWLIILSFVRHSRKAMTEHLGGQPTTFIQFFLGSISFLIMFFAVLREIGVSPDSLLAGAGIASITISLVVSVFVGNILSGVFVFGSHRFRVGDDIIINNIPGRIIETSAMTTRVRTDTGVVTIPNSAIASGMIIITKMQQREETLPSRLPYLLGDRVVTTYMQSEGTVAEITPLHTRILLDSGRELTFPNNSVLAGSIAVAKITSDQQPATGSRVKKG